MTDKRVVVGVSGGVDSSMALVVLQNKGYTPIAVSLKLPVWIGATCKENSCCTDKSIAIAKDVCKKLGIEHHIVDERKNFEKEVVGYFKKELKNNRTPNPCVVCNRFSKIKALIDFADKHKIPFVATGHYAKIKEGSLCKPKDKEKDQTYGLCLLRKEWLKRIIFPLEDLTKEQVYKLAQKQDFDYFSKTKQSQDFCYVSGNDISKFIEKELGNKPGNIVTTTGEIQGKHNGLWYYTLGQRRGLGRNGTKYYVCGFDTKKNQLIVTSSLESKIKEIIIEKVNLLDKLPKKIKVKVRYTPNEIPAKIQLLSNNTAKVIFDNPQAVVTPGQFCVFYSKDKCLGGGIIK
ncbi:MAG TPA: tRNA 2-thiouridine(34) synthase MnmA [archaeon]|nr:tRNA 2-thiouridine(34) synthase MnmA [archaeon]